MEKRLANQNDHAVFHYHYSTLEIIQISLKDTIKDDNTLEQQFHKLKQQVIDKSVKKVLVINSALKHKISANFQQKALLNFELPLLNTGVDKIAFVLNNDAFIDIEIKNTERKKYFNSEDEAIDWLNL